MIPELIGRLPVVSALAKLDVDDLVRDFDYRPSTTVEEGVRRFVDWYRDFYGC